MVVQPRSGILRDVAPVPNVDDHASAVRHATETIEQVAVSLFALVGLAGRERVNVGDVDDYAPGDQDATSNSLEVSALLSRAKSRRQVSSSGTGSASARRWGVLGAQKLLAAGGRNVLTGRTSGRRDGDRRGQRLKVCPGDPNLSPYADGRELALSDLPANCALGDAIPRGRLIETGEPDLGRRASVPSVIDGVVCFTHDGHKLLVVSASGVASGLVRLGVRAPVMSTGPFAFQIAQGQSHARPRMSRATQ